MILLLSSLLLAEPREHWSRAATAAAAGDFATASEDYLQVLNEGVVNEDVYYNLGNSLYRQRRLGEAILAWRRAALLDPRDPDVQANLAFARRSVRDDLTVQNDVPWFAPWQAFLSSGEGSWLGAALLGAGLLLLGLRRRIPGSPELVAAGLSGLGLLVWGGALMSAQRAPAAVVLSEELRVSSELSGGVELFRLHLGAEVQLGEAAAGQRLILLPDGRKGWVPEEKLGIIDPDAPFPGGAGSGTSG